VRCVFAFFSLFLISFFKVMQEFEVISELGTGAFALCRLVRRKNDGRLLAIKTMHNSVTKMTEDEKAEAANEVNLLAEFNHPNIISYVSSFVENSLHHIVMEFASGGSMHTLIQHSKVHFPEDEVWEWLAQMTIALQYIHSHNILHRDIKPQNILLWGSTRRVVKLADFGIAKTLRSASEMATLVGTPYYLAPEICEGKPFDKKSDIWSLGCVLFEIMALKKLFKGANIPALILAIIRGKREELPPAAQKLYSSELIALLDSMLKEDVQQRQNAEILQRNSPLAHRIGLWRAVQDAVIAIESEEAQNQADQYLLAKSKVSEAFETGSPRSVKSRSKMDFSSLEQHVALRKPSSPLSSESSITDSQQFQKIDRRHMSISSHATSIWSAGMKSSDSRASSSGFSQISLSSLSEHDARMFMSRYLSEFAKVFKWGSGQRRPILDDQLLTLNASFLACPRFNHAEAEGSHTLATTDDAELFTWGNGYEAQLGHGLDALRSSRIPRRVDYFKDRSIRIERCACNSDISFALSDDGRVYAWGDFSRIGGIDGLDLKRETLETQLGVSNEEEEEQAEESSTQINDSHEKQEEVQDEDTFEGWPEWARSCALEMKKKPPPARNPFAASTAVEMQPSDSLNLGERVDIVGENLEDCGVIRFIGRTEFAPGVDWYGIELDEPIGKNDGTVNGIKYFQCRDGHGVFVHEEGVRKVSGKASTFGTLDRVPSNTTFSTRDSDLSSAGGFMQQRAIVAGNQEFQIEDHDPQGQGALVWEPRLLYTLENTPAIEVCCGERHVAVLSRDGRVYTWGGNDLGQLGLGDDNKRTAPTCVPFGPSKVVKAIACGAEHMLAVSGEGEIFSWGRGAEGQLGYDEELFDEPFPDPKRVQGIPSKAICVAAGCYHSAAVTDQGEVFTWGDGSKGQLGHGTFATLLGPLPVEALGRNGADLQAVAVSCGAYHTAIRTENRLVYCWGDDQRHPDESIPMMAASPQALQALTGIPIRDLVCGSFQTFVLSRVENPQDGS